VLDSRSGRGFARWSLRERTIDNLVDSVDRFPLARTATKNENAGDEVELRVIPIVMTVILAVLAQNNVRDAHRLSAMTA
jgi:hypothetical protein